MIWLRYKKGTTQTSMRFNDLGVVEKSLTRRAEGTTLREIDYAHTLSVRRTYEVVIGADEACQPTKKAFLVSFWEANAWWLSQSAADIEPDDADFVRCNIPSGEDPRQLLGDHVDFPSFTFKLTEKYPRT